MEKKTHLFVFFIRTKSWNIKKKKMNFSFDEEGNDLCPICNQYYPVKYLNEHTNLCIDNQNNKKTTKSQLLTVEELQNLDLNNIPAISPPVKYLLDSSNNQEKNEFGDSFGKK